MKKNFGFQIHDPYDLSPEEHQGAKETLCQETPWYNILSNPHYIIAFHYIGAYISER